MLNKLLVHFSLVGYQPRFKLYVNIICPFLDYIVFTIFLTTYRQCHVGLLSEEGAEGRRRVIQNAMVIPWCIMSNGI